jgi:cytidylate kinase
MRTDGSACQASVIAIDGPAAVGKSTVGRRLAVRLGYLFLDTGAIYRALTLVALLEDIPVDDGPALASRACSLDLEIVPAPPESGRLYTVYVEGVDRTAEIRSREVDAAVSRVSEQAEVREAVLPIQRRLGCSRSVVVGRDIGTVVLPDADCKLYLDASPEVRASRRLADLLAAGRAVDLDTVLAEIQARDAIDSSREVAPLRRADDAITVLTDHLSEDEVLDLALDVCCRGHARPGDVVGR